jgi:hypothetical protein
MLALLGAMALNTGAAPPDKALPRIVVRSGRFVEAKTGRRFVPRGFNYIRLRKRDANGNPTLWHDTLNPASYSAQRTDAMFADLQQRGFNVVRIFLDPLPGAGFVEQAGAEHLSPAYMRNLLDFLERARAHRVYVIPCFCYLPDVKSYRTGAPPDYIRGHNVQYLHTEHARARARYMADVAAAIKKHDPALLSTVFAYELENESNFMATEPPFSLTSGMIHWEGKSYDASKPEDLQRLADDGIIAAVGLAHQAVTAVDRQAMVGVSVFTFRAVGRSGPGKLREDKTPDPRFPARPLAVARSKSAYVDVHFYPVGPDTLDADFRSIELPHLKEACREAGKPMIVGEIGAFKFAYADPQAAAAAMRVSLARLFQEGFAGFLYWTYDNEEQAEQLWHALSGNGEIMRELEKAGR